MLGHRDPRRRPGQQRDHRRRRPNRQHQEGAEPGPRDFDQGWERKPDANPHLQDLQGDGGRAVRAALCRRRHRQVLDHRVAPVAAIGLGNQALAMLLLLQLLPLFL